MSEPITFERHDDTKLRGAVDAKRKLEVGYVGKYVSDGERMPDQWSHDDATEDDLRAAGFVRVPSVEELVDTINLAEEAWCDSPEEAMDCGPYVARAVLRALGVQS